MLRLRPLQTTKDPVFRVMSTELVTRKASLDPASPTAGKFVEKIHDRGTSLTFFCGAGFVEFISMIDP